MPERHPIATAPKDGTRVRLFHDRDEIAMTVTGVFEDGRWEASEFFLIEYRGNVFPTSNPTHWSPLVAEAAASEVPADEAVS